MSHATPQRFGAHHLLDWCAAGLFLAVPIVTGANIWGHLGWASDTGRLLFLTLALLGVGCAALYYVARIAVSVVVAPEGIAAARGPWRHELRWREVARLLERTETVERRPIRWLVAEAHDGRRLQICEHLVAEYPRFRAAVYAAQQRWRALDAAGVEQSGAYGPLYIAQEQHTPLAGVLLAAGGALVCAVYLWSLLTSLRLLALMLGAAGLALAAVAFWVLLRRRSFALDDDGVEAWSRFPIVRLEWRDVVRVERLRPRLGPLIRGAAWASERLRTRMAGQMDWVGEKPWPRRRPDMLLLRGGGRRMTLALQRLRDPEAVLARVERGMQLARWRQEPVAAPEPPAAQSAAPQVAPPSQPRAGEPSVTKSGDDEVESASDSGPEAASRANVADASSDAAHKGLLDEASNSTVAEGTPPTAVSDAGAREDIASPRAASPRVAGD